MTPIQTFVLGRLREQGPMRSLDFASARANEMGGGHREWAMRVLRRLEGKGLVRDTKSGRPTLFEITPEGRESIAGLPAVPETMTVGWSDT